MGHPSHFDSDVQWPRATRAIRRAFTIVGIIYTLALWRVVYHGYNHAKTPLRGRGANLHQIDVGSPIPLAERLDNDELTRIKFVSGGQTREMLIIVVSCVLPRASIIWTSFSILMSNGPRSIEIGTPTRPSEAYFPWVTARLLSPVRRGQPTSN